MDNLNLLRIVRPLNLLILTFYMTMFFLAVVFPLHQFTSTIPSMMPWQYLLLVVSTVFIAAGGYVINDYFDVPIDQYNKPDKMVIGKYISEDNAFYLYLALTFIGVVSALIIAISVGRLTLVFYQIFPVVILWIYAQSFKKVFLVGNVMVAFLSGLVIIVPTMYEINVKELGARVEYALFMNGLLKIAIAYASFAFLTTLIREIIKDIEDIEGDKRCGAKTLPISMGVIPTKGVIAFLFLILLGSISAFLPPLYKANEVVPFLYLIMLLIFPLLYMMGYLFVAKSKEQFGRISFTLKVFMLSGMFTMIYFFINYAS